MIWLRTLQWSVVIGICIQSVTFSQDTQVRHKVEGTVCRQDTREVLSGAELVVMPLNSGTVSDINGHFRFDLEPGEYTLTVKYMGFREKQIPLDLHGNMNLEICLVIKEHPIDEVSIIASLRTEDPIVIGRPIVNIGENILNTLNTNDVNDAIHGRIPGVWDTKISGAPGDHHRIRIRGINSIFGSADPLYVVDGMIVPIVNSITLGISDLNAHDVENISILKDAASTALYGYLGGNGVILVDTKKGGGKNKLNFSYNRGIQAFSKRYDLMNSEDFLNTVETSDKIWGTNFYLYIPGQRMPKYPRYLDAEGTPIGSDDQQDAVFTTGHLDEYNLSGQGS
ncbi:MAG: hypothetical protein EHM46_05460, partial [Bacteroidetes bacterium]